MIQNAIISLFGKLITHVEGNIDADAINMQHTVFDSESHIKNAQVQC